jgi:hypothetical protein
MPNPVPGLEDDRAFMRRKIIIDTDHGIDDAVALLLALAVAEALEVLGLVAVAGNLPLALTAKNARCICELAGRPGVPAFAGCAKPLLTNPVTAEYMHGETRRACGCAWRRRMKGKACCRRLGQRRVSRDARCVMDAV